MASIFTHPVTSSDVKEGPSISPAQRFEVTRAREEAMSRLLMAFVTTGLIFMVFPGTFLGVWNLLQISGRESVASISPAWLQAHGHAQVFGWVGSFILGIGFYSIPKMRGGAKSSFGTAWVCWAMWTTGAALRWVANVYLWEWRFLLPLSALLELAAFLIFFHAVSHHRPEGSGKEKLGPWIWVVISACTGLLLVLVVNLGGCLFVSFRGTSPAFPHLFDQRYLALMAWGFLVPFVWGFSAKWMTVFLGLKPLLTRWLLAALVVNLIGLGLTVAATGPVGSGLLVVAAAMAVRALRMFEPSEKEAKIRGVHSSFPFFVRMAYGWLMVAAVLGVAATRWDTSGGIWGASRHALTVGFIAVMVMCVGQRILPAFAGMRLLWSTRLMFTGLVLVTVGCTLRVSSEVLAYQGYANWAWSVLPVSAMVELAGITAFAINIFGTFILEPSHAQKQPLVAGIS
jgi:uncharacterized protein involved in response to NO